MKRKLGQLLGGNILEGKKLRSEIEIYIHGDTLIICEYFSHNLMDKLIEQAERKFGLIFTKKCRSMCG